MIDAQLALQGAIVTAVKASTAMRALIGNPTRIYDRVPTNGEGQVVAPFPYVSFGPMTTLDSSDDCHDGAEVFVQMDCWSRAVGQLEAKTIGAALVLLLDAAITVSGFQIIVHEVERVDTRQEPDGLTARCIVRLRYVVAPTT